MKILKFSASWCAPCKMLAGMIENAELDKKVEIQEIDIDENMDMARKFNVRGVPTLVVMEGEAELRRLTGLPTKEQLLSLVE